MPSVLTAHDELQVRFALHQAKDGFYVDRRQGRRALLALNTVEETEWAIRAYRKPRPRQLSPPETLEFLASSQPRRYPGVGTAYLTKYGLLQAMQLQQLAAETVALELGFPDLKMDKSNVPRLARHNAAAHPFSDKGAREDHYLDRSSVFDNVLKVMSFHPDGSWSGRTDHIPEIKAIQRELVAAYLGKITDAVDARYPLPRYERLADGRIVTLD